MLSLGHRFDFSFHPSLLSWALCSIAVDEELHCDYATSWNSIIQVTRKFINLCFVEFPNDNVVHGFISLVTLGTEAQWKSLGQCHCLMSSHSKSFQTEILYRHWGRAADYSIRNRHRWTSSVLRFCFEYSLRVGASIAFYFIGDFQCTVLKNQKLSNDHAISGVWFLVSGQEG